MKTALPVFVAIVSASSLLGCARHLAPSSTSVSKTSSNVMARTASATAATTAASDGFIHSGAYKIRASTPITAGTTIGAVQIDSSAIASIEACDESITVESMQPRFLALKESATTNDVNAAVKKWRQLRSYMRHPAPTSSVTGGSGVPMISISNNTTWLAGEFTLNGAIPELDTPAFRRPAIGKKGLKVQAVVNDTQCWSVGATAVKVGAKSMSVPNFGIVSTSSKDSTTYMATKIVTKISV